MAGMLQEQAQANEGIKETEEEQMTEMVHPVNRDTARVNLEAREKSSRNRIFNKVNREVIADAVKAENTNLVGSVIYGPNDEIFEDQHNADIVLQPIKRSRPEFIERPMSNFDKAQLSNRELKRKVPKLELKAKAVSSYEIKDPDYTNLLE